MKQKKSEVVNILLVDDNPDLLYSVKIGLESLSKKYKVLTVEGGKQCLQSLKKSKPDIILLDIMMPDMDGWDTCAKIKNDKKNENIPIVFLTAKTDPVSRSMGGLAAADYITKPFDIDDLKKRIDSVLKTKK
jgi:DNA-binding response OmpR family regulator